MSFASATAQLKIDISNFADGIKSATKQVSTFSAAASTKIQQASTGMAKFAASAAGAPNAGAKQFAAYRRQIDEATASLNKHRLGLKDTARIVQGIIISQAFYQMAGAIREATGALWQFNESLDYASVSFAALFGDADLGEDFLSALRKEAEETIFSFEDLTDSARKLLAYGIPKENLLFITEGLTNLGAMSGDAAALNRIALALGQIYTKGKLSAEEMRQLANAYVPIAEIVQTKFGLSDEDMGRVGDLNLPAEDVINAVIDYANERFSGVGDAAMMTITGLKDKIVDSAKNLGVDLLRPVTVVWKSFLKYISDSIHKIGSAYESGGIKGLFEYLVPDPNTQQLIRQTLANISNLFTNLMQLLHAVKDLAGGALASLASIFNVLAPIITTVNNILLGIIQTITGNATALRILSSALVVAAGAWLLFKTQAIAAAVIGGLANVIYGVAKAVLALSAIISASPIVAGLLAIAVGFAAVAAVSKKADNAVSSLFDKLSGLSGKSSGDILQDSTGLGSAADEAERFGERMSGAADAVDDVGDAAETAGKKAKKASAGLLSFDEVFKLNEPTDSSSTGSLADGLGDDLSGILDGLDSLADGLGDSLIPEIPDFSTFAQDFVNSLKDSMLSKLAISGLGLWLASKLGKLFADTAFTKSLSTAALAIAKGFITALNGAFIGLALDAIIDPFTDKLWKFLAEKLKLGPDAATKADIGGSIGAIIGGAIGALIGGIPGAVIGALVGEFAGGFVGLFWDKIAGAFNNTGTGLFAGVAAAISKSFGAAFGEVIKTFVTTGGGITGFFSSIGQVIKAVGIKEIAKGGLIGMAIGFVVDAIAALLWDWLAEKLQLSGEATGNAKIGQTIGGILGTIIGGIFGGPGGALVGSALGTFAGGFVGLMWEKIEVALGSIGESLANWWTMTVENFNDWWNNTTTLFGNWWGYTSTGFSDWWHNTFSGLSDWWDNTVALFSDWDSITADTLGTWWSDTTSGFSTWWSDTKSGFSNWSAATFSTFTVWSADTKKHFDDWSENTLKPIKEWVAKVIVEISLWAFETKQKLDKWIEDTVEDIKDWVNDTVASFVDWVKRVDASFKDFNDKALKVIGGFIIAAKKAIGDWCSDVWNSIREWFANLLSDISTWWDNLWDPDNWTSGWDSVSNWFSELWSGIRDWFGSIGTSISSWWDGLWSNKRASVNLSTTGASMRGYATGGIVNREQVARIAEGNRAEAIIPLQDEAAMQPFVNAISSGIIQGLAPTLLSSGGSSSDAAMPPMYVGTLIADERGLKQLYRKFEVIALQENTRKGMA